MTLVAVLLAVSLIAGVLVVTAGKLVLRLMRKHGSLLPSGSIKIMSNELQQSLMKRIIAIAILGLSMAIPLGIVENIVDERGRYYDGVVGEIASLWGREQVIQGPLLLIPFVEKTVSEEKVKNDAGGIETKSRIHYRNRTAVLLPQTLDLSAEVTEHYRKRAIYQSLVYAAKLQLRANFARPNIAALSDNLHRIEWDKAKIVVGLSDTKSIDSVSELSWNGKPQRLAAGTGVNELVSSGFHAPLNGFRPEAPQHRFELDIELNGSGGLRFAPLGETTRASIRSSWPHPSFAGNLLPDEHTIRGNGFDASWEIPHLARNYPQQWLLDESEIELCALLAGVDLFEPVYIYSRITRAVKYGLLIVALTYLAFLIFELSTGTALHLVQYALIGAALALFYLLLLSLAEHIGFALAYLCATSASVALISAYVGTACRSRGRGVLLFLLLSTLYGLLYALLQMEDYALLTGSFVLFAILVLLMYLTRDLKVDAETAPPPVVAADAG